MRKGESGEGERERGGKGGEEAMRVSFQYIPIHFIWLEKARSVRRLSETEGDGRIICCMTVYVVYNDDE